MSIILTPTFPAMHPPLPGDLSSFKIVDLVEIAGKKGVSEGRNATRESLTDGLVKAGGSTSDAPAHLDCVDTHDNDRTSSYSTSCTVSKRVSAPVCSFSA
jgi:hypothetical protein